LQSIISSTLHSRIPLKPRWSSSLPLKETSMVTLSNGRATSEVSIKFNLLKFEGIS
jgi:hypothetical protein